MSKQIGVAPGPGQIVPPRYGRTWSPQQVIYRQLSYDAGFNWFFTQNSRDNFSPDVQVILHELPLSNALNNYPIQTTTTAGNVDNSISIVVRRPSIVVIELDPTKNWEFDNGKDAFTIDMNAQANYGDLTYVGGDPEPDPFQRRANCKIIYFSLITPAARRDDAFSLYLKIAGTPKVIDPDIKNRGGDDVTLFGADGVATEQAKQEVGEPA